MSYGKTTVFLFEYKRGLGMKAVEDEIVKILKKSDFSLTIDEIARKLGITRQTTSKYLLYLEGRGAVKRRDVGTAKLYYTTGGKKR